MDATDKKILTLLSQNANTTAGEIARQINLSVPAVNKRILKMREGGIIRTSTVLTDARAVGKPIIAFIFLVLRYGEGVDLLLESIAHDEDILECYAITGDYDYIIKICAASVEELEEKLLRLKKQKGVVKSHTMLSLAEHKNAPTVLPL